MQTIEHMQTIYRKHGFTDYLQEHRPKINISELTIPDDSDVYSEMVSQLLEGNPDLNGYSVQCEHLPGGELIRKAGRQDIKLVG